MPSVLAASAAAATPPIIAAVSAAEPASMSPATTEAPAGASPAEMDLPMPEPAPVTTATDPSIFMDTIYRISCAGNVSGCPAALAMSTDVDESGANSPGVRRSAAAQVRGSVFQPVGCLQ